MPMLRVFPIAILVLALTSPSYGHGGMGGMHGGMGDMHGGFHDDHFHDDHFHDGHFHGNVFFGFGSFAPFYPYGYPYPYYPYAYAYPYPYPPVTYAPPPAGAPQAAPPGAPVPLTPPPPTAHPPASYVQPPARDAYYFCPASKGYYPYVATCAVAWRPVPATPPQLQPRYAASASLGIAARQKTQGLEEGNAPSGLLEHD
jgi:hypothetical protein